MRLVVAILLVLTLTPACKKDEAKTDKDRAVPAKPEPPAQAAPVETEAPVEVASVDYQLRGEVLSIKVDGDERELELHHEAIPEFVNRRGEKVGMMSMIMPFDVSKDISLAELAKGDKISIRVRVDWKSDRVLLITALEKLPAETELAI